MARILLTATLFSLAFSPQLMAAEAQLRKPTPPPLKESNACTAAYDKCQEAKNMKNLLKDLKALQACADTCGVAEEECKSSPQLISDHNSSFSLARSYKKYCRDQLNKSTQKQK